MDRWTHGVHSHRVAEIVDSIVDLVLGRACAGCDAPGSLVCPACALTLKPQPRSRKALDLADVQAGLRVPVACAVDYRGPVRRMLYRYKDHRMRQLVGAFAPVLASAVVFSANQAGLALERTLLVPMPTRRQSLRRRGFDATDLLVGRALRYVPAAGSARLLVDTRRQGSVKTLGAGERELRAVDAFSVRPSKRLPTGPVILIDDVITTGSTVKEAVATLLLAGVHVAAVATAAGTP